VPPPKRDTGLVIHRCFQVNDIHTIGYQRFLGGMEKRGTNSAAPKSRVNIQADDMASKRPAPFRVHPDSCSSYCGRGFGMCQDESCNSATCLTNQTMRARQPKEFSQGSP
jgi:hypothetical protein